VELTSWAFNSGAHRAFESYGFRAKSLRFELAVTSNSAPE
jgi:hypothetical protein